MTLDTRVVEAGSGNVFEDLGFADAGERRLKVQLAMRVNELIEDLGMTQVKAAKLFVIPQPHVSELANYKLSRFSSERLMHFITLLDRACGDRDSAQGRRSSPGHGVSFGGAVVCEARISEA